MFMGEMNLMHLMANNYKSLFTNLLSNEVTTTGKISKIDENQQQLFCELFCIPLKKMKSNF